MDQFKFFDFNEEENEMKGEESYGLSWQAVSAITLAFQKAMTETLRGNEFDASECIFDFQLVWRDEKHGVEFGSDPGLYVKNPPSFKPLSKEELKEAVGEE